MSKAEKFITDRLMRRLEQSITKRAAIALSGGAVPAFTIAESDYARLLLDWLQLSKDEWQEESEGI